MEDLSRHILYLLSRFDKVCVPGIGTFTSEKRAACYNKATGRWLPPVRRVMFDRTATLDTDHHLIESFRRRLGVDNDTAKQELAESTGELLRLLENGEGFHIGALGNLIRQDDIIVFQPTRTPGQYAGMLGRHGIPVNFF